MTDVDIDLASLVGLDEPDPDDCAHIIRREGDRGAERVIIDAATAGSEVEALCGYRWVPTGIAGDHKTACAACVKAWEAMQ